MDVKLIAYTKPCNITNPEVFVAACAKGCYSEKPSSEILYDLDGERALKTLDHIVKSGHESVVEHLVFTFSIDGISRACANQLVRHRMASYSQQSQRYVDIRKTDSIVYPPSVLKLIGREHTETGNRKDEVVYNALEEYECARAKLLDVLAEKGIPSEDMRYFASLGCETAITVTMNARSLLNFFKWRCCTQAQWEIRELANRMLAICKEVAPTIFADAGPECKRTGCREGKRSCRIKEGNE